MGKGWRQLVMENNYHEELTMERLKTHLQKVFSSSRKHDEEKACKVFEEFLNNIKMKDKYYTPKIEEFHVGFEYEGLMTMRGHQSWSENDYSLNTDLDVYDELRVKYLDKEDIEELGFKHLKKSIDDWFELEGDFNLGSWTSYKIQIHYGYHDHILSINAIDRPGEHKLFEGVIKNKSELIKLLIQLRIITTFVSDEAKH